MIGREEYFMITDVFVSQWISGKMQMFQDMLPIGAFVVVTCLLCFMFLYGLLLRLNEIYMVKDKIKWHNKRGGVR